MKKNISILCLAVLCAACSAPTKKQAMPAVVKIDQPKQLDWVDQTHWLGSLKSLNSVVVKSRLAERVKEIRFIEGQWVKKGQSLVLLDDKRAKAKLETSFSRLQLAKSNFERASGLFSSSNISQKELDVAQSEMSSMQAAYDLSMAEFQDCVIEAPFDGVITQSHIDSGELLSSGTAVASLVQLSPIKLEFWIAERYLPQVKKGSLLQFEVPAFASKRFEARVEFVSSQVDPAGRMVRVTALYDNPDASLLPGMSAQVRLDVGARKTWAIPETALVFKLESPGVYVMEDSGKVRFQPLHIGERKDGFVEIISGLQQETRFVTEGALKLSDGTFVTVHNEGEI